MRDVHDNKSEEYILKLLLDSMHFANSMLIKQRRK